jgi:CBS domain-containing protein
MHEIKNPHEQLATIANTLRAGGTPSVLTVREFLGWFGAQKRSSFNVWKIRQALTRADLATDPDFMATWIDGPIAFRLAGQAPKTETGRTEVDTTNGTDSAEKARPRLADISTVEGATHAPKRVVPDSLLSEAVTIMLKNDFSQVPVMPTDRDVKGVITWQSIASRLALERSVTTARDVMEEPVEFRLNASIFAVIPALTEHGYVLVRGPDNTVVGIVTSSDLNHHFQKLTEPFLLLSEIENRIRGIITPRFGPEELASVRDPRDSDRRIESVDDMNFGEYIRLLEEPSRWERLHLAVDRKHFIEHLKEVRDIRNDVMHFDPDPIPIEDTRELRDFTRFLRKLETIGVT